MELEEPCYGRVMRRSSIAEERYCCGRGPGAAAEVLAVTGNLAVRRLWLPAAV